MSRSTLRRRLVECAFRGTHRDAQGQWLVPVADLIQAGLSPAVSLPTDTSTNGAVDTPDLPAQVAALEAPKYDDSPALDCHDQTSKCWRDSGGSE